MIGYACESDRVNLWCIFTVTVTVIWSIFIFTVKNVGQRTWYWYCLGLEFTVLIKVSKGKREHIHTYVINTGNLTYYEGIG